MKQNVTKQHPRSKDVTMQDPRTAKMSQKTCKVSERGIAYELSDFFGFLVLVFEKQIVPYVFK